MSYRVRYTRAARDDLRRLFAFLLERDLAAARRARAAIDKATDVLQTFPMSCRKADAHNSFLRELIVPFGSGGYVLLFEIEADGWVTILAARHQREADYY